MLRHQRLAAVAGTVFMLTATTLAGPAATVAHAGHFRNGDSVDDGEIRWEDETRYDDARKHAINAWDNRTLNKINIAPDAWNTNADLEWEDKNRSDVSWDGLYKPRTGADAIQLNVAFLKDYSKTRRRGVATHELGHALGIGDHARSGIVMSGSTGERGSVTTPRAHDKEDYKALWG